jgi:coenzyme F420-reducing hydrogenase delta subunit
VRNEVVVFVCNWSGWSCIEATTNLGFHYPACAKLVKVSCLSRLQAGLILKAFELGAGGIMLLGCEPDACHFGTENKGIMKEYEKARSIMEIMGIGKDRLVLLQLPPYSGQQFAEAVTRLVCEVGGVSSLADSAAIKNSALT